MHWIRKVWTGLRKSVQWAKKACRCALDKKSVDWTEEVCTDLREVCSGLRKV